MPWPLEVELFSVPASLHHGSQLGLVSVVDLERAFPTSV